MNKIYQSVEDPVTKTKRIKCDLCDNTYSHHPALRYHRLREHGKHPIARKKGQRKRKNTSDSLQIGKTTEQGKLQLISYVPSASQNVKSENDSPNNTTDEDESNDCDGVDILYRNQYKSSFMKSRTQRYEHVIDPVTNKRRIKCDLCENTYSHHTGLRTHRFKAHGKFPVARKPRKYFPSINLHSMDNEANISETSDIIEYSMEDEANMNEIIETEEYNMENSELDDDNMQEPYNEDINSASQIMPELPETNELLLNRVPKIEYVEIVSSSFEEEHHIDNSVEENIEINKSNNEANDSMETCGLIKMSMDYTILNINCCYCNDVFPLSSWEEFMTHLKEIHQEEQESYGELETPSLDARESYENRDVSFKIEIDHDALTKSENWDENNKTDNEENEDDLDPEYKPNDQVKKTATCDECKKTFRNPLRLKIHQRRRHNVGINRRLAQRHCNICNKTFKHPSFYRKHITVHFPPKYKCDLCNKEYRWAHSYNDHLKQHENTRDHVCEVCGASFFCHSRLRQHTKLKHAEDNAYSCLICEYTCKTSMDLWLHRRSVHLVLEGTIEQLIKNPDGKTLENSKDVNDDEEENTQANEEPPKPLPPNKTHSKSKKVLTVPCNLCDKFFRDEENLQNHKYRVHQVQRHELADRHCSICNRTFKLPSMYRYHMAVHRPPSFKCQTCGKEFRWRKSLTDHTKIHDNQRDHICELCGAAFFHNVRLHDHKKMWHNDEKNYPCSSCELTFKTSTQLCQHRKKAHILEDEANQNKKSKDYPSKRKPKGHRPKKYQYVVDPVTKVKRLKCDLCDNTYSHHPALRYHRFNEHGKLPIKTKQFPQEKQAAVEPTLEEEVIYLLTSEEQVVVEEQEEKIDATDYFIVYDAEEV